MGWNEARIASGAWPVNGLGRVAEAKLLPWEFEIYSFIIGCCLGSFMNVLIHRLPRGESIVRPRSRCPSCGHPIAWYDNIPLLSFLWLRARCRHCRGRISPRYFIVELIAGMLTMAVYIRFGLTLRSLVWLYLALSLIVIAFIDLDEMIIPDRLTLPGIAIGLLAALGLPDLHLIGPWLGSALMDWGLYNVRLLSLVGSVLGMFVGGGLVWLIFNLYFAVRKEAGIGGGDFTLMSMIGAFLGWRAVLFTLMVGSVLGLAAALVQVARGGRFETRMKVPFGPFLSLAALMYLFFGEAILRWYLS